MRGKVCLVTGSNSGIGKVTALVLARYGAQVVMLCRNPARGEAAQAEIKAKSGNQAVDLLVADLTSPGSIRQAVQEFLNRYTRLDVLVNNAGGLTPGRVLSAEGIETNFAANYLGPFLLTNLLLNVIRSSAPARIVNVSSLAHVYSKLDLENLQLERGFSGFTAYSRSKRALILFTYELARRLAGSGVTVNCLHPGFVRTEMGSSGLVMRLSRFIQISPEKGARTSLYLACSPEVEGVTGKYYSNCKPVRSVPQTYDQALAARLWEISALLTGLT